MSISRRSFVIRAVNALVALACCAAVSRFLGVPTVTDGEMPLFFAAAAVVALVMNDDRRASLVLSSAVLLIAARVSFYDMDLRFAAYGVVLASALVVAFFDLKDADERIGTGSAVAFLVAVALPFRFIAVTHQTLLPNVLAVCGGIVMILLLSRERTIAADVLLAAALLTLVTPSSPPRLSLFSIFGALVAWFVAAPSPFSFAAVAVVSLLCGKWFVALAAVVFVLAYERDRRRRAAHFGSTPAWLSSGLIATSARSTLLGVDFVAASMRDGSLLPLLLLFVLAAVLKPGIAVLVAAVAIAIFSAVSTGFLTRGFIGALGIYWLATSAWGGVVRHMFPVAASLAVVAMLAVIVFLPRLLPWPRIAAIAVAALFVCVIAFRTSPPRSSLVARFSLMRGENKVFRVDKAGSQVDVVAAGANLVGLTAGTRLGTIDFLDSEGKAYRREIVVGDISDWGTFRDGHFFTSRNSLPDVIAGTVMGEGTNAALTGAGRIGIDAGSPIVGISVTADPRLPSNARLNFESVESRTQ